MIDPDVEVAARHWGLDPSLIQAVVTAEGDIVKAVKCSVPSVQNRQDALDVLCRSCTHMLCDYVKASHQEDFVYTWAARWAPIGAKNDPNDLNINWPKNVLRLWV